MLATVKGWFELRTTICCTVCEFKFPGTGGGRFDYCVLLLPGRPDSCGLPNCAIFRGIGARSGFIPGLLKVGCWPSFMLRSMNM